MWINLKNPRYIAHLRPRNKADGLILSSGPFWVACRLKPRAQHIKVRDYRCHEEPLRTSELLLSYLPRFKRNCLAAGRTRLCSSIKKKGVRSLNWMMSHLAEFNQIFVAKNFDKKRYASESFLLLN